eukprot:6474374-Amphidinium_carterae.1
MQEDVTFVANSADSTDAVCQFCWLATRRESRLHWHLRRVLPSIGFSEHSADTAPHVVINRDFKGQWQRQFASIDLPLADHVSKGLKSVRAGAGTAAAASEPVLELAWASSVGLIVVLTGYMQKRRERAGREAARRALSLWLGGCSATDISTLTTPTPEEKALCMHDDDNQCGHIHALRKIVSRCQRERGWQITELFMEAQTRLQCQTVKRLLRRVVLQLAAEIDGSSDQWKAPDSMRAPELAGPSGKKRTLEPATARHLGQLS